MRWRSLLAVVLLAAVFAFSGESHGQGNQKRVEVSADKLTIDQARHTARFEGKVVARYGDLTITCDEMTATYGESGAIVALEASGHVAVRRGDATAEARSARLDVQGKLLVLEGAPTVTRGRQRLEGRRIAVHLDTFAVEVLEARGTFTLPIGEGR